MLFRRILFVAISLLTVAFPLHGDAQDESPSATASDWPSFHGGSSRTGQTEDTGPIGVLDLRWRVDTALGSISSSPAVAGGVVYVGTGLAEKGALVAIDLATGQLLWAAELADDFSVSSPAVANGTVFIAGLNGNLFAVRADSGELEWQTELDDGTTSSPAVSGETLFIGDDGDRLYAFDTSSGDELWRFDVASGGDYTIDPSPAVQDGVVYAATLRPDQSESLFALDADSGQQLWSFEPETPGLATPAVSAGVVYSGGEGGVLYALNAATGDELWRSAVGRMASAPAVGFDIVYAHVDGELVAVDAPTGTEAWRMRVGGMLSSPAVAADSVVVGGDGSASERGLLAFNERFGTRRWQLASAGAVLSSPAIVGNLVVFGSDDGAVYAFGGTESDGTASNGDGSGAYFSSFVFSTEIDERGVSVDPKTTFPAETTRLFAAFDFAGMANETPFTVTWSVDGEFLGTRKDVWKAGPAGHASEHILSNEGDLPPGRYMVVLTIAGFEVLRGSVEIG